jgi:hypothetical protein
MAKAKYDTTWLVHSDATSSWCADCAGADRPVGGRFICRSDHQEDEMAAFLSYAGLTISDTGQCEVFASRSIPSTAEAVSAFSENLQSLAMDGGYRLIAIEGGDPEIGNASVLASERSYVPEWKV